MRLAALLDDVDAWDRAMVTNDPDAIGQFMAEDWTIVGPDGSLNDKRHFLQLVRSGVLTHDIMETHEVDARVYGDAAVVVGRGVSGGTYHGQPFRVVERVSSVFIRKQCHWQCVLTHLSRLGEPG
jgi:ketosteroid isomerase-like protein